MIFRQISSYEQVVQYLYETMQNRLGRGQKILWLVPGGSAMQIAVETAEQLRDTKNLSNLCITLTDERYGPPGHKDSNWRQLADKGFVLERARLQPVLSGKDLETTAKEYSDFLNSQLKYCDYSIALAGLGADGHIFGIKPGSHAISSGEDVIGYKWNDYTRITPTANLLERLDEILIYATGEEKWPQLDKLKTDQSVNEQPAQILKQLKNVIIFNDHKGEAI
jgi:6-phosphogluconolactonase/glucosamine-6-phosphate isomerase/deaminase